MTTTQRKGRLVILFVICTLACITLLCITTFVDGTVLATTYSPDQMHTGRSWQIAQVDDVFANTVLVEDSMAYVPITTGVQWSGDSPDVEAQHTEFGVVLIPYKLHPLHSGRTLQFAHIR